MKKDEALCFGTVEFTTVEMLQCDMQLDEADLHADRGCGARKRAIDGDMYLGITVM